MQDLTIVVAMSLGNVLIVWGRGDFFSGRPDVFWRWFYARFSVGRFGIGFRCYCFGRVRLVLGFQGSCSCSLGCIHGGAQVSMGDGLGLRTLQKSLCFSPPPPPPFPIVS